MLPMPLPELELLFRLDSLFQQFFSRKRRLQYGVAATDAEPDLSKLFMQFRFLAGRVCCCPEPTCHLPYKHDRLTNLAATHAVWLPAGFTVHWHCIVERGSRFQVPVSASGSSESEGYEFQYISGGPVREDPKPPRRPANFTGLWINAGSDGARTESEWVNGIADGVYRSWNAAGVCLRDGYKKDGKWHGPLTTCDSSGRILDVSAFHEGTGTYRIFNARGQMTDEIPLVHGKRHGTSKRWVFGKLVELRHCVDGVCVAINLESSRPSA